MKKTIAAFVLTLVSVFGAAAQAGNGSVEGQIKDFTGAVILGATVSVSGPGGFEKTVQTSDSGRFLIDGLEPGVYKFRVENQGFAAYENENLQVASGQRVPLDINLEIEIVETEVLVSNENLVDISPDSNTSAIILNEEDIKSLPDDEEDLAAALQALAGPGAGPNGGGIYVDGFSGGSVPPRDTIREVRINSNPFASEYERLGYGRIEILTKPGTDRLRGSVEFEFEDESFNSRNPFVDNRPAFQKREFEARLSGPIIKNKASFFLNMEVESTDSNSFINALVLDQNLNPLEVRDSAPSPASDFEFNPRVDFQLNENNTLVVRYGYERGTRDNAGLGGFNLPSRGFNSTDTEQTLRVTETAVLSPRIVNETRFQYIGRRNNEEGLDASPTIRVLDAFTSGGANIGSAFSNDDRFEFSNSTSFLLDNHSIKAGGVLRYSKTSDSSPNNFAGTFTFTSLDQYRDAILGNALPAQFAIAGGDPLAGVSQTDVGAFIQDDWRVYDNLTLSFGLRYENQTNISSNSDIAPRFGFAWAPFAGNGNPKTVIRGGYGIFYDRYNSNLSLREQRFNGINQQQYIVGDPSILSSVVFTTDGVTNVPTVAELTGFAQPQTIRTSSPAIRSPYTSQFALSVERQLPFGTTFSATYLNATANRLLRSRNINAPVNGVRPIADAGNIFQYESTGRLKQQQMIFNVRTRFSDYSIFANYSLNSAKSDTDGAESFPVDQYDLLGEYGRSSLDARHRFVVGGSYNAPLGFRIRPFVIFRSGSPYNITTGSDSNGDTLFNERPTFADLFARCSQLGLSSPVCDPSGISDFNRVVPRNYGTGPNFFIVNLRTSKAFEFGTRNGGDGPGASRGGRGGRWGGPFGGGRRGGGRDAESRYSLEFTVQIRNLFNRTNLGTPVGNINSQLFAESLSTAGGFGFGRGSSAGGNRRIEFEVQFDF